MKVFCYRYYWSLKDSDKINFKIVADIEESLAEFERQLLSIPNLVKCAKEYICEYDCALIGHFESLTPFQDNIEVE